MSNFLTIAEAAFILKRSVITLQRWDREGVLIPQRTPKNRRVYTKEQIEEFQKRIPPQKIRQIVAYCRMSFVTQSLQINQKAILKEFCSAMNFPNVEHIEEIENGKEPHSKFLELINSLLSNKIRTIVLESKDELDQSEFDILEFLCKRQKCKLLVTIDAINEDEPNMPTPEIPDEETIEIPNDFKDKENANLDDYDIKKLTNLAEYYYGVGESAIAASIPQSHLAQTVEPLTKVRPTESPPVPIQKLEDERNAQLATELSRLNIKEKKEETKEERMQRILRKGLEETEKRFKEQSEK